MTCIRIEHGFLCGPDDFVNLESYGAKVWMAWNHHLGPTFYRSAGAITEIRCPSMKTWKAFAKWHKEHHQ